jgi:hypothetical protein
MEKPNYDTVMWKRTLLFLMTLLLACDASNTRTSAQSDTTKKSKNSSDKLDNDSLREAFSNERFRDVTVEKIVADSFRVRGKAQVFEAAFSWVVVDGDEEVGKGFQMTNAGAPEWGDFIFLFKTHKKNRDSKLHLILFEASPKDGSRQFQLRIPLY